VPIHRFQVALGGSVLLDCEVMVRFGRADPLSLQVYAPQAGWDKTPKRFNPGGIMVEHQGEPTPLSEFIVECANQEIDACLYPTENQARKPSLSS
jgi:hypothetical protein